MKKKLELMLKELPSLNDRNLKKTVGLALGGFQKAYDVQDFDDMLIYSTYISRIAIESKVREINTKYECVFKDMQK